MAPYDVFANPSSSASAGNPYGVVIRSDPFDSLATRLHALAHFASPLPAKVLRRRVGNVAAQASALVSAMDAVAAGILPRRVARYPRTLASSFAALPGQHSEPQPSTTNK